MSKEIPLYGKWGKGKVALVSEEDYGMLDHYRWIVHKCGKGRELRYPCRTEAKNDAIKGRRIVYMHRTVAGLTYGDGRQVDHVNGNTLDNRRENLRACDQSGNARNMHARWGRSGFKGVISVRGIWKAQITANGQRIYVGQYHFEEEAARAYDKAALRLHGRFANLNFPDDIEGTMHAEFRKNAGGKLGREIIEFRKSRSMTQRDFARLAGLSAAAVCLLERSDREPHAMTYRKLVAALGDDGAITFVNQEREGAA